MDSKTKKLMMLILGPMCHMQRRVYRHRLSPDVVEIISEFARIHEHDSRKDYKQSWLEYVALNRRVFDDECLRLSSLGFKGDSMDKMFKAGRYYFRKKPQSKKTEPKARRVYIGTSREMLKAIDQFITDQLDQEDPSSPAICYEQFINSETGKRMFNDEIANLTAHLAEALAKDKLKKTFKNRYYRLAK